MSAREVVEAPGVEGPRGAPDQAAAWDQWNVAVLKGPPQQCTEVLFQTWSGLGWEVFPEFVAQVRYLPRWNRAEYEQGLTTDPTVLHRAWELFAEEKSLAIQRELLGEEHPSLGVTLHNLSQI